MKSGPPFLVPPVHVGSSQIPCLAFVNHNMHAHSHETKSNIATIIIIISLCGRIKGLKCAALLVVLMYPCSTVV